MEGGFVGLEVGGAEGVSDVEGVDGSCSGGGAGGVVSAGLLLTPERDLAAEVGDVEGGR